MNQTESTEQGGKSCPEEEEWEAVREEAWVVPAAEWGVRVEEEAAAWEDPLPPDASVSASVLLVGTANPMSGACRARRGSARNAMRR
jgi:hypothetical protein